ncbi:MAG TPA: DUF2309 domain-containing protein [Oligoflexia bacterium]|nr:DUF2309 domain-containing protein [Oligoflexia bacterium]HMP47524.1 DUF2309 domain-containing protein [Oligoflexia bacterium]
MQNLLDSTSCNTDKHYSVAVRELFECAKKVIAPSWSLQNIIAVNPFWNLIEYNSDKVFHDISRILHSRMYMSSEYYLRMFEAGKISPEILNEIILDKCSKYNIDSLSLDNFIKKSQIEISDNRCVNTFSESLKDQYWNNFVINEFSKFASSYFDTNQALVRILTENGFWSWWKQIQLVDKSLDYAGFRNVSKLLSTFSEMEVDDVVGCILDEIEICCDVSRELYLKRLLAGTIGWSSRFSFNEWEAAKGKNTGWDCTLLDCLVVRLCYDYLVFKQFDSSDVEAVGWKNHFAGQKSDDFFSLSTLRQCIWQDAFEKSFQGDLTRKLKSVNKKQSSFSKIEIVFCIDVRSEIIRRHIESLNNSITTRGFAGFFGLSASYKRCNHSESEELFPVLLTPSYKLTEKAKCGKEVFIKNMEESQNILGFLRSLRKGALSSFAYVELFGCLALERFIRKTFQILNRKQDSDKIPNKFDCSFTIPELENHQIGENTDITMLVSHIAQVLRHMGLAKLKSRLVVFTGHGSQTTNNAFASSLDCGACGGHSGDINARFMALLLNKQSVRDDLKINHDIQIPDTTHFLAAVHETVTDEIYLLDIDNLPKTHLNLVEDLKKALSTASSNARNERHKLRPVNIDPNTKRRGINWSETRPEWGLAGNACFIVAPRYRTSNINLEGRSFLHDYYWQDDSDFKTLELIMTAPMLVTNWINMQYYSSTVAPDVYGAGNKVLHNIVNESGVFEGNGGDLRIGLPLQSVFDGIDFIHEPLRLSVFIEAPRYAIEDIISRHSIVQHLVDNKWLHIFHIWEDENSSITISKRKPGNKVYENF